jgi:hypothetical protein
MQAPENYYGPNHQHLLQSEKTKDWHKNNLERITAMSNWGYYYTKDKTNYDLVNGIINQEDFEYVTKPYGVKPKATLPEDLQHFPIITTNIKALEGEFLKRPDNFRVYSMNPQALSEYTMEKDKMINDLIIDFVKQTRLEYELKKNPELQQNQEELQKLMENIISPEEIQERLMSFQDSYELMGNELMKYLYQQLELRHEFRKSFLNGLIAAKEPYKIYRSNNEPAMKAVNPLRFFCDLQNESPFIHDSDWAFTIDFLTPSKIIEIYSPDLTEDEKKRIVDQSIVGVRTTEKGWKVFTTYPELLDSSINEFNYKNTVQVIHTVWRSYYKVGFLTYLDENGVEQVTQVTEHYKLDKAKGDISIEWDWWPEIRECTKIGTDMYVRYGVVDEIPRDPDNPFYCPLPYTGIIHNNLNSKPTSAVDLMKPYNYMYDIVKRMVQKDIASDKGRKILANINQIPTSMGIDLDKWQHYLEIDDIIWVNPNEEGNRGGTDLTSWRSVDLTAAASLNSKIQYLEYLEQKCKAVIGLNDPRTGQAGNNELVGTTQMQIAQSQNITEPWFTSHELGKKAALTLLLNAARIIYANNPKQKLSYVTSDRTKKIIEMDSEKLSNASYGVFVSAATEDVSRFNTLKQMFQMALQSQMVSLSTVAKAINGDFTPNQLVGELEKGEARMQQMQQQAQQSQQETQMAIAQAEKELEQIKLELERYKIDTDAATRIRVAEIGAFKYQKDLDTNSNDVADFQELEQDKMFEERKATLEETKTALDASMKRRQLEMDRAAKEKELNLKRQELALKNKQIETDLQIARENKNKYDKK